MRLPDRVMFPLMRHSPVRAAGAAAARRLPLRQSQGATKSPRHRPRRAAFAERCYPTYALEYFVYATAMPCETIHALMSSPPARHTATMRP